MAVVRLIQPVASLEFLSGDLLGGDLFGEENHQVPWRLAPEPFAITPEQLDFFKQLGEDLLEFYLASEELFVQSLGNRLPSWVFEYLTLRIDPAIRELFMAREARGQNVRVIRPDVLLTKESVTITELDSVPGGIGWTAALNRAYERAGFSVIGAGSRMEKGFAGILQETAVSQPALCPPHLNPLPPKGGEDRDSFFPRPPKGSLGPLPQPPEGRVRGAIVVSQEASDYWDEMLWLQRRLDSLGYPGEVLRPEELSFDGSGLVGKSGKRSDVLYRFFELFDYRSISSWDLIVHALKTGKVRMTPPAKSYLEEKFLFALFHHPCLENFWRAHLSSGTYHRLKKAFPKTWILDPRPVPPHSVVPNLEAGGRPIQKWEELHTLSQKQRRLVLKPSGYSPLAWGSRGVVIGHDQPQDRWAQKIQMALENFANCPYVLQQYHPPRRVPMTYFDAAGNIAQEEGRVRLCPYYFVYGGKAHLSGILATICPLDKKLIHGMPAAVMAPCSVIARSAGDEAISLNNGIASLRSQ